MEIVKVIAEVVSALLLIDVCVFGLIYYNSRERNPHVHRPRVQR